MYALHEMLENVAKCLTSQC